LSKWRIFILLLLCGLTCASVAQTVDDDLLLLDLVAQQSHELHMTDTLMLGDSAIVLCDTIWKQYPHPLCLPLMYVPEIFPSILDTATRSEYSIAAIRRNALRYITAHHADFYTSVSDPNRLKAVQMGKAKIQRAIVKDIEQDKLDAARALRDMTSPWRKEANLSLQLTQNYATPNWHQGGANAFSMLWGAKASAKYKKDNIAWENKAEWRVGLSTVSGDSLRKMNTTDDIFLMYSKLGYQLHKHWYLSLYADFRTSLFPNFQQNSMKCNTTFFTPLRYSMGLGIDCKPIKGLTINISPMTYKLTYALVDDPERVNVTDFGIETGLDALNEVGSSLRVDWKWKPLREIEIETRFYFFTNYKQVETELEIDVDFLINRYMSAKLLLYPRYDGTVEGTSEKRAKLQFKELISVGFAHTFR